MYYMPSLQDPMPHVCAVMYYIPAGTNLTGIPLTQVHTFVDARNHAVQQTES